MQRRTGGGLAETLTNLSGVIRARKALRLKAQALASESKASAAVLAILPFIVFGLLSAINPALMSVLFTDPRGRTMLGFAFISIVVGIGVMAIDHQMEPAVTPESLGAGRRFVSHNSAGPRHAGARPKRRLS